MSTKENKNIINKSVLADIKVDFERWADFLNKKISILLFTFALACLNPGYPGAMAFASFASFSFILLFMIYEKNKFPRKLRELSKAKLSELDSLTVVGLEKKYNNIFTTFKRLPMYFFAWSSLTAVACYGVLFSSGPL